jgi:PD-(D/E)XK nuclease superfamily protein
MASLRMQTDSKQKGTLLHRLLDLVLAAPPNEIDWRTVKESQLRIWLEARWRTLLEQEGANLLLPGQIANAAAVFESGVAALLELFQQMRTAQVTTARSNIALATSKFMGGQLEGIVDLLVERESAKIGLIDLKLGGREMREQELRENRPLQLAVYGYLMAQGKGAWPEGAFFLLNSRRMLAQNNAFFPSARVISTGTLPSGLRSCWTDFEQVWRWRQDLLDAGWIEVTADGCNPDERPPGLPKCAPPLTHWKATEHHSKYNEFDALTGWRADA